MMNEIIEESIVTQRDYILAILTLFFAIFFTFLARKLTKPFRVKNRTGYFLYGKSKLSAYRSYPPIFLFFITIYSFFLNPIAHFFVESFYSYLILVILELLLALWSVLLSLTFMFEDSKPKLILLFPKMSAKFKVAIILVLLISSNIIHQNTFVYYLEKDGGMGQANTDFDRLKPKNVENIEKEGKLFGRTGVLKDGRKVTVRTGSSEGSPSLEVDKNAIGKGKIKIRYSSNE